MAASRPWRPCLQGHVQRSPETNKIEYQIVCLGPEPIANMYAMPVFPCSLSIPRSIHACCSLSYHMAKRHSSDLVMSSSKRQALRRISATRQIVMCGTCEEIRRVGADRGLDREPDFDFGPSLGNGRPSKNCRGRASSGCLLQILRTQGERQGQRWKGFS